MALFKHSQKKTDFLGEVLDGTILVDPNDREKGLQFLINFFNEIRPGNGSKKRNATNNMQRAIKEIYESPMLLANLQHAFISQLTQTKLITTLTESGIPLSRNFWQELFKRVRHKILPALEDEDDFLFVLSSVFNKRSDYKWVESIPRQNWVAFFEATGISFNNKSSIVKNEFVQAFKILSFQVAQLGLEKEVAAYLPKNRNDEDPVFVKQNYEVHRLTELWTSGVDMDKVIAATTALKNTIEECYDLIEHIRDNYAINGASLNQTYIILILTNRLERMLLLVDVLDGDSHFDTGRLVDIFRLLVRNEKRKNSIREFLSQGAGYLAYQIAEHKDHKGHKYITSTRAEYFAMIRSAMWGGFIISFIAVFKNLLARLTLAPFTQGFLYSINYSLGFVLIEETHSTLATKQPAFTASAVAGSLDIKKHGAEPDLNNLAITVAKVSRSQIASFFGNLIIVFPLTFALALISDCVFHFKIADEAEALKLLRDQHPWQSPALLYACFTGFFLFLSGLVAGYVQNKVQYGKIKHRLKRHPTLRSFFSEKRLDRIASYVERNAGSLFGSIALGFFLGFAGITNYVVGIPFDIRHITISAGNVGIGLYGLSDKPLDIPFLITVFLGVLAIGLLNFLVSFSLAFIVAVKSRGIHLSQYPQFLRILSRYFFKYPIHFVKPGKLKRASEN